MKTSDKKTQHSDRNVISTIKDTYYTVHDWVMDHTKIVMPAVLIICVGITILIAVTANQKAALAGDVEVAAANAAATAEESTVDGIAVPEVALEEDAYPEINSLVRSYYDAMAAGDTDAVTAANDYLDEIEIIRVEQLSKYIESYPTITVYTKAGMTENSYVAYVYSKVKFIDCDEEEPGMQTYYIAMRDDGTYSMNDGEYDSAIINYIEEVSLQDDVVDLNNKVVVEYNELLANDAQTNEYVAYLQEKINEDVGEILAAVEVPVESVTEETTDETATDEAATDETKQSVQTVVATDVVNIRSSDSETADKVDKAQVGQEFTLLEEKGNGWSKIEYNGEEAYIKTEFLEAKQTTEADTQETDSESATDENSQTEVTESASSVTTDGTVTVKETVRIRAKANTDSDVLGTVYMGEKLEFVEKQSNGWTKITYKGNVGYVKSDFVE